jgi:hypothetical protein
MLPGPKEPDADQLQEYLRLIVDDLIKLFDSGIRVPTPSSPEGIKLSLHICNDPPNTSYSQGVSCE